MLKPSEKPPEEDLYWTVDADFDFTSKRSDRSDDEPEFFCDLYLSDEKHPEDHRTLKDMRKRKQRKQA